jgi:hypothetical protein
MFQKYEKAIDLFKKIIFEDKAQLGHFLVIIKKIMSVKIVYIKKIK